MCECGLKKIFRCTDCFGSPMLCAQCVISTHIRQPLHRVEKWTDTHFSKARLGDLGMKLHLGHEGKPCPTVLEQGTKEEKEGTKMTIVHLNGHHTLSVVECKCRFAREEQEKPVGQLMGGRLFPGSLLRPHTAYTFELMEHWHLETLQSKKPTWDYWQALCQKTKLWAMIKMQKGYNEFLRSSRYWRVLKMLLRSGQSHGIDDLLPKNRWPGNTAVICPACPEPEFNLKEGWEKLAEEDKLR
ncbi:hypothetical protein AURDEDRAFT_77232 [Auricularia subglabra TFB-10046 SS5]|uniref:CxC2-like cysteine cluster KDZ transposase-associated domain-containing protein n=1 Tax=Auricularia subglabra (strain TFB-10046 / SS5) TaxID=717982 RepID=J0WL94_AURST|nr:hypothetical protein AURDEDRAFT_77232 [Auricularia subglabra TFB-10046 SS5]